MTDYEMAALFIQIAEASQAGFANFMALVTGMLAISWFVGHRLPRGLAIVLILIFSIAIIGFGNEIYSLNSDLARLGAQLQARGAAGAEDLMWLGPARATGENPIGFVPNVVLFMMVSAYVATLWFFFHARARARRLSSPDE